MATLAQIDTAFPGEEAHEAGNDYHDPASSHSSTSFNPGWTLLGGMSGEKKLKADGQPPKRRGPKPDSKPAMTRRQELNRQAQRTHRERKEHYVKAIEVELGQLKGLYTTVTRERNALKRENQHLQDMLAYHGIDPSTGASSMTTVQSTSGSFSGSYRPSASADSQSPQPLSAGGMQQHQFNRPTNNDPVTQSVEYNQAGIDFVLALERPCMDHIQFLVDRSSASDIEISGHARMITCPPHTHDEPTALDVGQLPEMDPPDLNKLLDLSNRLPLNGDGEVTPIMAWQTVIKHEYAYRLELNDIMAIRSVLLPKVRCYGFGAVLEEFEVGDAIIAVLTAKSEASRTPL